MIAHGQNDKAFKRLQTLLEENPNPDLYIQAALLSASKTENISAVNSYLEKAYKAGTGGAAQPCGVDWCGVL